MYGIFLLMVLVGALALAFAPAFDLLVVKRAGALMRAGERDRARALLERVLRLPPVSGERQRIGARHLLSGLYLQDGQPDRAIEQCRLVLAQRIPRAFEGTTRRFLSICLDAVNQPELALQERKRAEAIAAASPGNPEMMLVQARLLTDLHRYNEARDLYARAIPMLPAGAKERRAVSSVQMALASFNAGRPQEAVDWADRAIAAQPYPNLRQTAFSTAALGLRGLGRLDEAEQRVRQALSEPVTRIRPETEADLLARLAGLQMSRGDLVQAIETCGKASRKSSKARRLALMVEAECQTIWGRFDEARAAIEAARSAQGLNMPAQERSVQGKLDLMVSVIEGHVGNYEAAWRFLKGAREKLGAHERHQLKCDAREALLLARQGREDDALRMAGAVESRAARFPADRALQLAVAAAIGRTTLHLGHLQRSQALWERYLGLHPDPVYVPTGWYHLGETHRKQGDLAAARAAYEQAAATGLDTRHARLAAERLEEMAAETPGGNLLI